MKNLHGIILNNIRFIFLITMALFLSSCTMFPSEQQLRYQSSDTLNVESATRLAAKAMLSIDFLPQKQNDAAGFVQGVHNDTDMMGFHQGFYLVVKISKTSSGELVIGIKSQAGGEVAMSAMPSEYLDQFIKAYEPMIRRKLKEQGAPGKYKTTDEYRL